MPGGSRPPARPGAGPGRGRSRARKPPLRSAGTRTGPAGTATGSSGTETGSAVETPPPGDVATGSRRGGATPVQSIGTPQGRVKSDAPSTPAANSKVARASLTGRAIALAVVILILVISYASSLRVYFAQAHEIAESQAEITHRQQVIEQLQAERARWDDPDYVRAQARERLGWVVPGEIGYRVVDADGNPVGGGERIEGESGVTTVPDKAAWWTKLRDSVDAADKPKPVTAKSTPPTVTVETKPGG